MNQRSLRLLGSSLLIGLAACASTPEGPPFGLSHPDHPEGWRRADLEHDDDDVAMWRIVLPRETKPPKGSGLRSESFKTLIDRGYTLESFYQESVVHEQKNCPGASSTLLDQRRDYYLYEATAPFESRCWGYQLVRLQRRGETIHALAVYSHRALSEEDRKFWLDIVTNAVFQPSD
jgi:hypothetical protein